MRKDIVCNVGIDRKIYLDIDKKRLLRAQSQDEDEIGEINQQILDSKYHIISYNVLVGACEDIPQIIIVLIVGLLNGIHTVAYISLGLSITLILWKLSYCLFGKFLLGIDDIEMQYLTLFGSQNASLHGSQMLPNSSQGQLSQHPSLGNSNSNSNMSNSMLGVQIVYRPSYLNKSKSTLSVPDNAPVFARPLSDTYYRMEDDDDDDI